MKIHIFWLCIALGTLFVGTQILPPKVEVVEKPVETVIVEEVIVEKPVEVIREVEVVKEVPVVVEKIVEVPAEIPEIYKTALYLQELFRSAEEVDPKTALSGVKSVSVHILLSDDVKNIISESDIRTKFEITLRKSGVPIDANSMFFLRLTLDGYVNSRRVLVYTESTRIIETVFAFRGDGKIVCPDVVSWRNLKYGTVGNAIARDALLDSAESAAEAFANEWLSMNVKPE